MEKKMVKKYAELMNQAKQTTVRKKSSWLINKAVKLKINSITKNDVFRGLEIWLIMIKSMLKIYAKYLRTIFC